MRTYWTTGLSSAVLLIVVATDVSAADCSASADEVNARCHATLQAAVDVAIGSDRPLVVPRGTYRGDVLIDYTRQARKGFDLVSHGATIEGRLTVQCTSDCFYFHQSGKLFVSGNVDGPLVTIGKADYSDPHNSIRIEHLIVNNGSASPHAIAVQMNHVLNADAFIVADTAGNVGLELRQVQFSTIRGAASATVGYALWLGDGYTFANTLQGLDLEASEWCVVIVSDNVRHNTFTSPYMNCTNGVYSTGGESNVLVNPMVGGDVGGSHMTTGARVMQ